jgi:hypothetical protein
MWLIFSFLFYFSPFPQNLKIAKLEQHHHSTIILHNLMFNKTAHESSVDIVLFNDNQPTSTITVGELELKIYEVQLCKYSSSQYCVRKSHLETSAE